MTLCQILNVIGGHVCVEAGVSVTKEVVKVFVNSNVAAMDQPKEEEMIIIYNIIDDQN